MAKEKITAHMVVKNEDRFIYYAISSVLPYVDRFLIFDTGSTDKTVDIISLFNSPKIDFGQIGNADKKGIIKLRQEQIDKTKTPWIWIVDGDEIYHRNTAEEVVETISEKKNCCGVIIGRYDLLGDIYHRQSEDVGAYEQFGKRGHFVLRLIRKTCFDSLKVKGEYPNEYFADKKGRSVKEKGEKYFAFIKKRIFHAMYLKRSTRGANLSYVLNRKKVKIELGRKISREELPQVFFQKKPDIVPNVIELRGWFYTLLAAFITPAKMVKRKLCQPSVNP